MATRKGKTNPVIWLAVGVYALWYASTTRTGDKIISGVTGMTPRGIRNNNPGNIRGSDKFKWVGEVGRDSGDFVIFDTPEHGIRAIARIIQVKWDRGLHTINQIISDYAPPVENLTGAYVDHVAKAAGIDKDAYISKQWLFINLDKIVMAIISHENGQQPYTVAMIDNGLGMA